MSITTVIDAMIAAADARTAMIGAERSYVDAFRLSAETTLSAIESGDSAVAIATAAKDAIKAGRAKAGTLYTSDSAIGFHALTGLALRLPGELPNIETYAGEVTVLPSDVQTAIKNLGQRKARAIITAGDSLPDVYAEMIKAGKALKAAKKESAETTDETDESAETSKPVTSVSEMIRAAEAILAGAVKREDWTAADHAAAASLVNLLNSKPVVLAAA